MLSVARKRFLLASPKDSFRSVAGTPATVVHAPLIAATKASESDLITKALCKMVTE